MRGRESRNNNGNDNNDDDNIAREQDSSGEGEEKYVRWILASRKPSNAISGFASFLNPWSGSLHPSIPITCPFLRIRITKGERNGINAPLPPFGLFASAVCSPSVSRAARPTCNHVDSTILDEPNSGMEEIRWLIYVTSWYLGSRLSGFSGNW